MTRISILIILAFLHSPNLFSQIKDSMALPVGPSVTQKEKASVKKDASFPGGDAAWFKYIFRKLELPNYSVSDDKTGKLTVLFSIDIQGKIDSVRVVPCEGSPACLGPESGYAKVITRIIKGSPLWTPATQDGIPVRAYRRSTLTRQ